MTTLTWSDEYKLGVDFQDKDHEEAFELINILQTCPDADLPQLFDRLILHSQEHFERENRQMQLTGFFAYGVHKSEHDRVLRQMQSYSETIDVGDIETVRLYVQKTLPQWLLEHLKTMDTITAQHLLETYEN